MIYEFENRGCLTFIQCGDEERNKIIRAISDGRCEIMDSNGYWRNKRSRSISFGSICRTLKPEPAPTMNQIDWSLVPKQYKYLYTHKYGSGVLSYHLPVEELQDDLKYAFGSPGFGNFVEVSEFDYGFKHGTVESIDSLLIRPIGE